MVEVEDALRSVAVVSKDLLAISSITLLMCAILVASAQRIASTRLTDGTVRFPSFAPSDPRQIATIMSGMLMGVTGQLMFAAVINGELSYHHMSAFTVAITIFFIFALTYIVAHEISASLLVMFGVMVCAFFHMNYPTVYTTTRRELAIDPRAVGGDAELASELTTLGRRSKVLDAPVDSVDIEMAVWVADMVGLALMFGVVYWMVVLVRLWVVNDLPLALQQVEDMGFALPQPFVTSLNKLGGVRGGGRPKRKPRRVR